MTTHIPTSRDTRIDVLRALALLTIFVNHVPGNALEHYTHKNFGFSDAAEAFVLISGVAVGLAYGLKFEPGRQLLLSLKAWRRAGVLYITHIVTTLATIAIFAAGAIWFARPELLDSINIPNLITDPPRALLGLATLGHQLGYNNILSMYAVVLVMVPLFLFVGRRSLLGMVALSGAIWLTAGLLKIAPPNYPTDGVWFLNPLSWQFLFVIGIAGMLHVKRGGRIGYTHTLAAIAAGYVVLSLAWVKLAWWGTETTLGLPVLLSGFDKTYLSLPRLLHILAIAYLIVSIPRLSNLFRLRATNPLAILGRHSLPVFVAGTLLAMAGQVARAAYVGSFTFDASLMALGIALQFALAYWLDWLPTIGWGGKPVRTAAVDAAGPIAKPAARASLPGKAPAA